MIKCTVCVRVRDDTHKKVFFLVFFFTKKQKRQEVTLTCLESLLTELFRDDDIISASCVFLEIFKFKVAKGKMYL